MKASFERRAIPGLGAADFEIWVSAPNAPVAKANTLAAVAVLSNKQENTQLVASEIEQTVDASVAAENDLVINCPSAWQHYFQQGDNRFVDSNYYS